MDANEKNLSVAMNLLEGILAKSRIEKDATKEYLIYFPVFDDEDGKILAKFPIFEIDGMMATLKGWQVYNLDDYRLDAFLLDNQGIAFDDFNTINYRNPEDVEKLMYFINIFLKVQEFKKTGRGIDLVPENKAKIEDLIGDFENNIVDNISEDVNRIYNYEIEYEDDLEADPSILDSIDSLDDYEDASVVPATEESVEEEVIEEVIEEDNSLDDEEETVLPGMSFEDEDITIEEVEDTSLETTLEDEFEEDTVLPGMGFEDEEDNVLPGMNFDDEEDNGLLLEDEIEEEVSLEDDVEEDASLDLGFEFEEDASLDDGLLVEEEIEEEVSLEDEEENILPGFSFDDEEDDSLLLEDEVEDDTSLDLGFEFEEDASLDDGLLVEEEVSLEDDVEEDASLDLGFEFEEDASLDDGLLVEEEIEEEVSLEDEVEEDTSLDLGFEFKEDASLDDGLLVEEELEEIEEVEDVVEDNIIDDEEEIIEEDIVEDEIEEVIEDELDDEFDDLDGFDEDDFDDIPTIDDLEALADQELAAENKEDDVVFDMTNLDPIESLDLVVGMDSVKVKVEEYQKYVEFVNSMNIASANLNLAFVGNKGTGKSIIADVVTEILFESGMVSEGKLIKVNKKELCGGHHHRGLVVDNIIETAMGGILLIDEACRCDTELCPEVTAKLLEAMDAGLVVIFSGCNEGMGEFLSVNKEIAARIPFVIEFPDYSVEELKEITKFKLDFEGLNLNEEAETAVLDLIKVFENGEGVNSKFTTKLFQKIILKHATNTKVNTTEIVKEDIPTVYEMLDYVSCDDRRVVSEVVKAVYNADTKLIVVKDDKIAVLRTKDNNMLETKSAIMNKVTGLLVGIAAEEVYFGEYSNNSKDLKEATHIVNHMVRNGMSDLGLAKVHKFDPEMTKVVFEETNKVLAKCFENAKAYVTKNKKNLDNVIEYVRENNEINAEAIFKNFENQKEEKAVKETKVAKETKAKKETVKKVTTKKEPAVKKPSKKDLAEKVAVKQAIAKKTTAKSAVKKAK